MNVDKFTVLDLPPDMPTPEELSTVMYIIDSPEALEARYPLTDGTHYVTEHVTLTGMYAHPLHLTVRDGGHVTLSGIVTSVTFVDARDPESPAELAKLWAESCEVGR